MGCDELVLNGRSRQAAVEEWKADFAGIRIGVAIKSKSFRCGDAAKKIKPLSNWLERRFGPLFLPAMLGAKRSVVHQVYFLHAARR